MSSEVDICNRALSLIGVGQIQSLTENSEAARKCTLFYAETRDTVLRDNDWTFARMRRTLASFTIPDDYVGLKYAYAYVLPADCLKPRKVYGQEGYSPYPYELFRAPTNEEFLMTNIVTAILKYTMAVTTTTWFDVQFLEALELKLASKLAVPLRKKPDLGTTLLGLYIQALGVAEGSNTEEQDPIPEEPQNPWIHARTCEWPLSDR